MTDKGRVSSGNHREMGTERPRTGGQARVLGTDAVRWMSVTTATQVPLPKIDAGGVQCGPPGALGSE